LVGLSETEAAKDDLVALRVMKIDPATKAISKSYLSIFILFLSNLLLLLYYRICRDESGYYILIKFYINTQNLLLNTSKY